MYKCKNIIIFTLTLLMTIRISHAENKTKILKIGYQDNAGFPLVMGTGPKIGSPPGVGVDIINQVAKDLNIKIHIRRLPNKRVHLYLQDGEFDGSGFYSFHKDRQNEGVYPMKDGKVDTTKRVFVLSYHMYVPQGSSVIWDGKKITGAKSVGANMGYSVVKDLKRMGIHVNEVKSVKQNLDMLQAGRIGAYAAQDGTIDQIIKSYPEYGNIMKVGPPIKTKEYYFMFSHQYYKENRKMAHKIWDQIEKVRKSVIEKYRRIDLKPKLE
ncbi:transporter substrate-binding domain-containing protein [Vibrio profundum]|uniref:substrate-binding periplasmic protein n=1 Tax=Vibrio profundum TaxID=2910247 RepID=UPI003D0D509B